MENTKGKLVIIEGVDGSGKATQADLLFKRLKREGKKVKKIDFPKYYDNVFGKLIGECLSGKHGDFLNLDPYIASSLYSCDRFETKERILRWLKVGEIVISDRYTYSSFIHHASKMKGKKERMNFLRWLEKVEYQIFKIPRPDLILYLDVSYQVASKLVKDKKKKKYLGKAKDVHEGNKNHLKKAILRARDLVDIGGVKKIDCVRSGKILSKKEILEMVAGAVGQVLDK